MDTKEKQQLHTNEKHHGSFLPPMWVLFLCTCVFIGILYGIFKDYFFSGYPTLTDLIVDQIALQGTNKTGEWNFFWTLTWIGCFVFLFLFILHYRISKKHSQGLSLESGNVSFVHSSPGLQGLIIFLPAIFQTVLYKENVLYLWLFSMVFYGIFVCFYSDALSYISLYLLFYFDFQAIVTAIFMVMGISFEGDFLLFMIPTLLAIAGFWLNEKYGFLKKSGVSLILQLPLPLLLAIYLKNSYLFKGQVIYLEQPVFYVGFFFLFILVLYGILVAEYRKALKKEKSSFISFSSLISIFLYGSYIPSALIVPGDMHHYGEQMLPYQQIFNLSMTAYEDYAPVSGLFPLLPGAVNQWLFSGKATTFYIAFTLTMILFATGIVFLLSQHVKREYTLLFVFLFHMPVYCRTWIILPVLLILMLPKVLNHKRRFLYVYVFSGFIAGLYYPLFGLALICSAMPFAFAMVISCFKEKTLQKEVKTKSFYLETLLLLLPIGISIPLLSSMAKHIISYSHQTLLADGLSLSGIPVPEWFIPYLSKTDILQYLRHVIYYGLRFLTPMALIWLCLLFLCLYIKKQYLEKSRDFRSFLHPAFYGLSASLILLPVCYTYTLVIMDEGWVSRLFSRSGHIYLWIFGAFLPVLFIKYGKQFIDSEKTRAFLLMVCISIGMISFHTMSDYQFPIPDGTTNQGASVIGNYTDNLKSFLLSDNMILISQQNEEDFESLGSGFIQQDTLTNLYTYQNNLAILKFLDPQLKVIGLDRLQMYYFLLNEPAPYSGKVSLAKSYEAQSGVFPYIDEHTIMGNDVKPVNNFYLYKFLMEEGFVYDPITEFYISKELYVKLYGQKGYEQADHSLTPFSQSLYLSKLPSVLGYNVSNLSSHLSKSDTMAEFLYVTINQEALEKYLQKPLLEDTILTIDFTDNISTDQTYNCLYIDYEKGQWLLPLSMNEAYLINPSPDIYISLFDASGTAPVKVPLKDVSNQYQYYKTTLSALNPAQQ